MFYRDFFEFRTKKGEIIDMTEKINKIVEDSKIKEGLCHVFFPGTTGGLITNENDSLLLEDFKYFFKIVDEKKLYHHPDNAFSHIRASLTRQCITIPVSNNKLVLGTWQGILFFEFDVRPRKRKVVVTVQG